MSAKSFVLFYSWPGNTRRALQSIVQICTHGGGGAGRIAKEIANLRIGCDVLPIFAVQEDGGTDLEEKPENWLKRVGQL